MKVRGYVKKKEYHSPELTLTIIKLQNQICTSVEDFNSQINEGGDWGDDNDDDIV